MESKNIIEDPAKYNQATFTKFIDLKSESTKRPSNTKPTKLALDNITGAILPLAIGIKRINPAIALRHSLITMIIIKLEIDLKSAE